MGGWCGGVRSKEEGKQAQRSDQHLLTNTAGTVLRREVPRFRRAREVLACALGFYRCLPAVHFAYARSHDIESHT